VILNSKASQIFLKAVEVSFTFKLDVDDSLDAQVFDRRQHSWFERVGDVEVLVDTNDSTIVVHSFLLYTLRKRHTHRSHRCLHLVFSQALLWNVE